MKRHRTAAAVGLTGLGAVLLVLTASDSIGTALAPLRRLREPSTVEQRLEQYGDRARGRLAPAFEEAGVAYPPGAAVLVGLKQERRLELWAGATDASLRFIRASPIRAASGELGPKLRQGDQQVPEGLYRITFLNPNSRFHLSLRIGYPNAFDTARGAEDGRDDLGGDIMIHGSAVSTGCLAMGDEVAEDLFVLIADTGREHTQVILSPVDFRVRDLPESFRPSRPWVPALHAEIAAALDRLRH